MYGYVLPHDTVVYYVDVNANYIRRSIVSNSIERFLRYLYVYDYSDGLYAVPAVRDAWRHKVHLHPHCTLFKMLQEKLRI